MKTPVSVFTSHDPPDLSKSIFQDANDNLQSKPGGHMVRGEVTRKEVDFPDDFADLTSSLSTNQALAYGIPDVDHAPIATREKAGPGELSRTREHFQWPESAAIMMLDYDVRPGTVPLSRDQLVAILVSVCPQIADCAKVVTDSASSHIISTVTGEILRGDGGKRVYLLVANGQDIPRAGQVLAKRLVNAGHGYIRTSGAGTMLLRTVVDTSVWQPERLDFAAGAHCGPGLVQLRPDPTCYPGGLLDTETALPPLTQEEEQRLAQVIADLKAASQDEAAAVRAAWVEDYVDKQQQRAGQALTEEEKKQIRERMGQAASTLELPDEFVLHHKGGTVTVGEVLADLPRWDGTTFCDPFEPGYHGGEQLAKLIVRSEKPPYINSFAHGGITYRFATQSSTPQPPPPTPPANFETLKQRVLAIPADGDPDKLDADLEPILKQMLTLGASAQDRVLDVIHNHLGIKMGPLKSQLRKIQGSTKAQKQASHKQASSGQNRTSVCCNQGLSVFCDELKVHLRHPVFQDLFINSTLTKNVTRVTKSKLIHYAFGSDELANLAFFRLSKIPVDFVAINIDTGDITPCEPPQRHLKATLSTPENFWPFVHHWCDRPVLLPDGTVLKPGYQEINGQGYYGNFTTPFQEMPADEAMAVLMETLSEVPFRSLADFANAMALRFTCSMQLWMGPMITPLFCCVARERGTGKTTALVLSTIVTQTALFTLSPNVDQAELEKRIATSVRNGEHVIILDNMDDIEMGSYIEGYITEPGFLSRLLGKNEVIQSEMRPLLCVNFNLTNKNKVSDANASRMLLIELDTSGSAVSRTFRNRYLLDDIKQDTGGIRTREINATLSLILPWIRAGAPIKQDIQSRFPKWTDMMSGLLHFLGIAYFMANRKRIEILQDPKDLSWGPVLHGLYAQFQGTPFRANQVVDWHRRLRELCGSEFDMVFPVSNEPEKDASLIGRTLSVASTWRTHGGFQYRCIATRSDGVANRYQIERKECTESRGSQGCDLPPLDADETNNSLQDNGFLDSLCDVQRIEDESILREEEEKTYNNDETDTCCFSDSIQTYNPPKTPIPLWAMDDYKGI